MTLARHICPAIAAAIVSAAVSIAFAGSVASAQDARTVSEPHIPAACTTLQAQLVPDADTTLAAADERRPDTERIQHAIDACAPGKGVVLAASGRARAFLTGPLHLRPGVTLVVGDGVTLFGSRDPRDYDITPGSCGVVNTRGHGCQPMIDVTKARGAGVMGPGTIDGRGWATLLGRDVSWWQLAEQARANYRLSQNCPRILVIERSDDFTLYRITLKNSPNFHVVFDRGDGFTAWGVVINTPKHARNTDGIDPSSATNVTITHSYISTGDDNVAIKAGGNGAATHMTISHDHFYAGHGMSIGSETNGGASDILVQDLSIDGADNGLRIKSNAAKGGLVHHVRYRDVCIRRTKNPIYVDTHYSASAQTEGTLIPEFRDIGFTNVRDIDGGTVTLDGYDAARPLGLLMDNVIFDAPGATSVVAHHVRLHEGPGRVTLPVGGEDVQVTGSTADAPVPECTSRFVPFPASVTAAPRAISGPSYSAIVDAHFTGQEGAAVDGVPTYRTLGDAIVALPQNGVGRTAIFMRNGRYHEKLTIDRPYLTLIGESRDGTILTYDAAAGTRSPEGGEYGTRGSYTLRIVAPDFRAENMTIENAFDYPANAAKPDSDPTKLKGSQGVALMLDMSSDRATFVNVKITGYQDTLFPNAGRAYFAHCEIWGNVDFIFGAGRAVFDDCDIVSRDRGSSTNNGYVTAPSTPAAQPYGLVFWHSRLKKEKPSMAPNSVTLGRPWHPFAKTDINSSAVYIDCWMDNHIGAKGWDRMSSVDSTGTRTWNLPENARFYEYGSTGPGAVKSPTRRVLTAAEAATYAPSRVMDGWIPPTTSSLAHVNSQR